MRDASYLNTKATPYNQDRNSQEDETLGRTAKTRGTQQGTKRCFTSEGRERPSNTLQALLSFFFSFGVPQLILPEAPQP
jgi:hypothetical protein